MGFFPKKSIYGINLEENMMFPDCNHAKFYKWNAINEGIKSWVMLFKITARSFFYFYQEIFLISANKKIKKNKNEFNSIQILIK